MPLVLSSQIQSAIESVAWSNFHPADFNGLHNLSGSGCGGAGQEIAMPDPQQIEITQSHTRNLTGQKLPSKPGDVWSIRVRLQIEGRTRDLALFNLAVDSKLRSCDLVVLRVSDVPVAARIKDRAVIVQQKTRRPVQFELTEQTRESVRDWITDRVLKDTDYLFPSRFQDCPHLSTRQYARIVDRWVESIGLD